MAAIKAFLVGWVVLLAAIVINGVASRFGLVGWYDFLAGAKPGLASLAFLFLLYPFLLGLAALLAWRLASVVDKGRD